MFSLSSYEASCGVTLLLCRGSSEREEEIETGMGRSEGDDGKRERPKLFPTAFHCSLFAASEL